MAKQTVCGYVEKRHPCCISRSCEDAGCSLVLPHGAGEVSCIKGSTHQEVHGVPGKLCDCILFWSPDETSLVAPVELKGGQADARNSVEQIQNVARVAQELLEQRTAIVFLPILVHRGLGTVES